MATDKHSRPRLRIAPIALLTVACALVPAYRLCADTSMVKPSHQHAAPAQPDAGSGLFDVDASGTDINYVLQALSKCTGANMVVSPDVTGQITANLKQMSLEAILDYLSTVKGFAWQKTGDTYLVTAKEKPDKPEAAPTPAPEQEVLVWQCRNIKPADATKTVQELFPSIKVVEGPGAVTPAISSTSSGLGSPLSMAGGSTTGGASTSSGPGGTANTNSDKIVLMGEPAAIRKAEDVLKRLDVARSQVFIKVAITEINSSANKELGIDWTYGDLIVSEAPPDAGIGFGKFMREGMSATGTLSALMRNGSAHLLAQPNISVLDGESANILIGDRILFPKLIGYSQVGTPLYDKEEEQVGIYLQIAAKISGSGEILMTLYPQVSLVTAYLKTQAGDYPQISTREARTTVSVKNGETLAIGGLLREDDIRSASKVPLLGDLPIIGKFFRRTRTTKERTEIVILLTPAIASS